MLRGKVLAVDDHPVNLEVLARQLALLGVDAKTAADGGAALTRWQAGQYDAVLSDIHMPGMDGYTLATAIRECEGTRGGPRTPIVAVTANAIAGEAERCLLASMGAYLAKPVTIERLHEALGRWLTLPPLVVPDAGASVADGRGLDRAALSAWFDDDAAAAERLVQQFLAAAKETVAAIRAAAKRQAWAQVATMAHRLRGSAATLGAGCVTDAAAALEHAAGAEDGGRCGKALAALVRALRRAAAAG
jgi:two-component system sensor histidine kinase EvgS